MEGGTRENGAEAAAGVAEEGVEEAEAVGSSSTMERVAAAKKFIENHYRNQKKNIQERKERLVGSGSLSLVLASDQKILGLGLSTNPSGLVRDIQLQKVQGFKGPSFSLLSGKAPYRPVHTGPAADRYADRSLPGSTAKIGRRQSIDGEIDCRRSIEEEKGKRRRGKEEKRSICPCALAAHGLTANRHCPRMRAARGSTASRCCPRLR
ncbi:hypothetical protein B296_00033412, partial [Ensete ventricosum]